MEMWARTLDSKEKSLSDTHFKPRRMLQVYASRSMSSTFNFNEPWCGFEWLQLQLTIDRWFVAPGYYIDDNWDSSKKTDYNLGSGTFIERWSGRWHVCCVHRIVSCNTIAYPLFEMAICYTTGTNIVTWLLPGHRDMWDVHFETCLFL